MKSLSAIHRWCGGFIGLLLAVLGLSGAILVWEGAWVTLPGASDPVAGDASSIGAVAETAASRGQVSHITFASEEIGLHQIIYLDGGGAYVRQDGKVVDQWSSLWERPELLLFDLHHYLFMGKTGEIITGLAGIAGILFVLTGLLLWWRSRRSFRPRLWPKRFAPGPIVGHHRDLGLIATPLLLLSLFSGVMMLFEPVRSTIFGKERRPTVSLGTAAGSGPSAAIRSAASLFPDAELRRIAWPVKQGDPIIVRLRQPFEWTPNGRTFVSIHPDGNVTVQDPRSANRSASIVEKLYPLHSAKVGGYAWKIAMTVSGLALALLGTLATWSFWARRKTKRARSFQVRPLAT